MKTAGIFAVELIRSSVFFVLHQVNAPPSMSPPDGTFSPPTAVMCSPNRVMPWNSSHPPRHLRYSVRIPVAVMRSPAFTFNATRIFSAVGKILHSSDGYHPDKITVVETDLERGDEGCPPDHWPARLDITIEDLNCEPGTSSSRLDTLTYSDLLYHQFRLSECWIAALTTAKHRRSVCILRSPPIPRPPTSFLLNRSRPGPIVAGSDAFSFTPSYPHATPPQWPMALRILFLTSPWSTVYTAVEDDLGER